MIEVTCGACGTTLRFEEADVPAGGKTVSCTRCQAKIALPPALGGDTGDVINLADLPAPKRPSPLAGAASKPARPPTPPPIGGRGLSAPKPLSTPLPKVPAIPAVPPVGARTPPAPSSPSLELDSIDLVDLPAPVGAEPRGGSIDLPAPKRASGPVPKRTELADLPAPKRADVADLPAPKRAAGPSAIDLGDLPAPKRSGGGGGGIDIADLPAPKAAPAAANDAIDLPAPKGFFDDLPAPRTATAPAPDSISIDLPAPKGFFDDLPAPAPAPGARADLPAPKGFFDDLPGAGPPAVQPPEPVSALSPPTNSRGLDLDDLDLAPPTLPPPKPGTPPPGTAPIAAPSRPSAMPLELEPDLEVPALELDAPPDRFSGLDLAPPTLPPPKPGTPPPPAQPRSGVVSFKAGGGPEPAVITAPRPDAGALDLDLDDERMPKKKPATIAVAPTPPAGAKTDAKGNKIATPGRTRKLALGAGLGVVVLGAGAFLFYQHWKAGQDADQARDQALASAHAQLAADTPEHWKSAQAAAAQVLAADPKNADALAIAAIADVAGYLDDGLDQKKRLADADKQIEALRSTGTVGPLTDKALGLYGIVKADLDGAITRLGGVATQNAKDADAQLFLGWAKAAHHDYPDAIAAFTAAAGTKARAISATYAMGQAQLAIGDLDGARKSFTTVLDARKDHIGAQIGIAETLTDLDEQEKELDAILQRKDIAKADPRAVERAHALAGDDARRAGRGDDARAHYREALKIDADFVPALVGTAELDLADGNLDTASTGLDHALQADPDAPEANLAKADLLIRRGKPADAEAALAKLPDKLPPAFAARAKMLAGKAHEADGKLDAAVDDYAAAQVAIGDTDIQPSIAEATVLGKLADAATDPAKQADYRQKAAALLAGFEQKAQGDADIALELGRAYLASGDGASAEKWLSNAADARKQDVEVRLQLAHAQDLEGKHDAAVATMRAAFELDPTRVDVGVELAKTYEGAGRNDDARAMYAKLLAAPSVTLDTRIRAGLFYARTGDAKDAAAQGDAIAKEDDLNPAGAFLRAEGLYAAGKYEDAVKLYDQASKADPQPLYLDGLGRAAEQAGAAQGDSHFQDQALQAYEAAVAADPKLLTSQLGRARLHVARGECDKAIEAFEAARALDASAKGIAYGEGYCYSQQGKPDQAIPLLARSLQDDPHADAAYILGQLYQNKDEHAAAAAYTTAVRLAKADIAAGRPSPKWLVDLYFNLGDIDESTGNESGACDAYGDYLASNPPDSNKIRAVKNKRLVLQCK